MNGIEARRRCWAEINLDNLITNYRRAVEKLIAPARLVCVLKANTYGTGAETVSQELYAAGARFFAVACVSEAMEIRAVLPDADILVLGLAGEEEAVTAIRNDIILTLYSEKSRKSYSAAAKTAGKPARVHIKADTGLHRLGFDIGDKDIIREVAQDENIKIEGLYSHLALRTPETDEAQFKLFDEFDACLSEVVREPYMKHICDSIGMVRYPMKHMDAVRVGAWLYGVCPSRYPHPEEDLPTVRFCCRVSDVRKVAEGECIGYDEDHPLAKEAIVATLSAGYVDGFPRLNNVGSVVIRGKRAPVLGLVCMDQMMVDVTDIPGVCEGDEVTLLGDGLTVNEYADIARLNRNEALCRLGKRVPKVYIKNNEDWLIK